MMENWVASLERLVSEQGLKLAELKTNVEYIKNYSWDRVIKKKRVEGNNLGNQIDQSSEGEEKISGSN